jgi:hypothetical protein
MPASILKVLHSNPRLLKHVARFMFYFICQNSTDTRGQHKGKRADMFGGKDYCLF